MRLRVLIVTAALLYGAAVVSGSASAAAGGASFALKPLTYDPALNVTKSYFVLLAKPGAVIRDRIRIVNAGGRTGTAYLYPVDATTGQTSGAVYLSRQSPRRDVGAWIRLGRSTVTLAPGANAIVPFTIRVPSSVRAGDHLGGIVAENAALTQSSGHGAIQIRIKHLTIDAVELQLPGRVVTRADVTGVTAGGEHGYQDVYLHLKNLGALTTKPFGQVLISSADGQAVATRRLKLDTFLPGTEIDYPLLLPKQALSPGTYHATIDLTYGASALGYRRDAGPVQTISRSFEFTVSSKQYTTVFQSVPPVTAPVSASSHGPSRLPLLLAIVGTIAALLGAFAFIVFGVRRWSPC